MELLVHILAYASMAGLYGVAIGSALIPLAMGGALMVGLVDGPTGGRLEERARLKASARRVKGSALPGELPHVATAERSSA